MSTKTTTVELIEITAEAGSAGGVGSEPGGRAQRPAGAARLPQGVPLEELPPEVRDRLSDAVIDELLAGSRTEEEIVGPGGVLAQLTKRLVERALSAELTEHLGYEPHQEPPGGVGNTRNGSIPKTLVTEQGPVEIRTPRDRNGAASSHSWSRKGSGASRASTTRSSPSTRAASRRATSRRIWRRSTG